MEFSGTQTMSVPIEKVWAYLLNVNKVAACAPGFQSLQETGHERWQAVVSAAVGPMKAKFTIDLTRSEMQPPERMVVKGRANAPGTTVEMSGDMRLTALTPDSTRMDWRASVELGGALANVGGPMVRGTMEKLTAQFFECLKKSVQAAYGKWS
ncbi:MAG: carbon monoxide dehydrogenase subunit G [Chloroflexi bacterium]|nr:carbon monoxide dehydrogenase subunit G [Ktedonobacteraceae bacterium]MBV8821908.1 carbon monoxide dehydrogenase subunit G [Ktedonobacteraceae bacterium]MBV9022181.1 carbon monoxide dehydrogenase subunit G [Ktedonobacteraceae bacterium]MBV9706018.1 carbon monoxide dehydrogenase subunit G [Chloroflexota bacterium]